MSRHLSSFYKFLTGEFLKLYRSGLYNDFEVVCQDGLILVPSFVLASVSPLIASCVSDGGHSGDYTLILKDVLSSELTQFVEHFLHTCSIDFAPNYDSILPFGKICYYLGIIESIPSDYLEGKEEEKDKEEGEDKEMKPETFLPQPPPPQISFHHLLPSAVSPGDLSSSAVIIVDDSLATITNNESLLWSEEDEIRKRKLDEVYSPQKQQKIFEEGDCDNFGLLFKQVDVTELVKFSCNKCSDMSFSSPESLLTHIDVDHNNDRANLVGITTSITSSHFHCSLCAELKTAFVFMIINERLPIVLVCPHCRKRFQQRLLTYLIAHIENEHPSNGEGEEKILDLQPLFEIQDEKSTTCDFCPEKFPELEALNNHLPVCRRNPLDVYYKEILSCRFCDFKTSSKEVYDSHISSQHLTVFKCQTCGMLLQTESALSHHLTQAHSKLHENCQKCQALFGSYDGKSLEVIFPCPHCRKQYDDLPSIVDHLKHHESADIPDGIEPSFYGVKNSEDPDAFLCEFCCEKAFKTNALLNSHIDECSTHKCLYCDFVASNKPALNQHSFERHENGRRDFECGECSEAFPNSDDLESHLLLKHNQSIYSKVQCGICQERFETRKDYWDHARNCRRDADAADLSLGGGHHHSCKLCTKKFKHLLDLEAHVLIHNGALSCPVHNVIFRSEGEISAHMRLVKGPNSLDKRSKCCICSSVIQSLGSLLTHLRSHFQCKPYSCSICDEAFTSSGHLTSHIENKHHSKAVLAERKYKCTLCPKAFKFHSHLREHEEGIHQRSQNVVQCHLCPSKFNTKKRLQKHWKNVHKLGTISVHPQRIEPIIST